MPVHHAGIANHDHVIVCQTIDVGVNDEDTYVSCHGKVSTTRPVAAAVHVFTIMI